MRKGNYTKEQVENARASLKALTEIEKGEMTKSKFLESLKPEILAARKTGKTWKEIAASLEEAGVDVSQSLILRLFKKPGVKKNANI